MNQALVNELAFGLRRIESFPAIAIAAIEQIHQHYTHFQRKGAWNPDLLSLIIIEFIYGIPKNSANIKSSNLETHERLQLAELLFTHLSDVESETDRSVLLTTFFPFNFLHDRSVPHKVLSLMTSLSLATKSQRLLKSISEWMIHVGIEHPYVVYILNDISTDLCTDEFYEKYLDLPKISPNFSAVVTIGLAKIFSAKPPPPKLFQILTEWVENFPSVCFLPPNSAIFDLFRWILQSSESKKKSRLHLALTLAILNSKIEAEFQTIPPILTLINELRINFESNLSKNYAESSERTTERLLQLIQTLLGANYLDRNEIYPIFDALEHANFPSTFIYENMKSHYLK